MTHYLYTKDKAYVFDVDSQSKGYAYNSTTDFPNACISYMDINGERTLTHNTKSDIVFYILSGEGEFVVGTDRFQVKATDSVIVPQNTTFGYFGTMHLIEFMTPSWIEGSDIVTEQSPRDQT